MRQLIFDAILLSLIVVCFSRLTYTRHRLEMNVMVVQGLQHQIDDLNKKLEEK
jgi:general stress protein CsbA